MKNFHQKLVRAAIATIAAPLCFFASCNPEEVKPDLPSIAVDQTAVTAPAEGGDVTLTVTSNRPWKLTDNQPDEKWLIADKTAGDGNATITLTVSPNADVSREALIRIDISTVYVEVRITQPGINTEDIFADDFGNGASSSPWPLVAEYAGWNKSGTGAENVTYSADGGTVSVRNNANSSGYDGASGQCNVMMAAAGASFLISNIDPLGITSMRLSFGANQTSDTLKLFYNTGGADSAAPYEKTTAEWGLVTVTFTIPAGSAVLNLKFTAGATQFGTRVDDVKLIGVGQARPSGDLRVSPAALSFAANGEAKKFAVTSTQPWTATSSEAWLTVTPASGSGNDTVTVTAQANTDDQRTATITVATTGDSPETKTVAVTQAGVGPGANAIYYEDIGATAVSGNTDLSNFDGWSKEGSGGNGVTYEGNTQVRTSVASTGYEFASGGNEIFFGSTSQARYFTVKGIALSGVDNIELTFGASKVKNEGGANTWDNFADGDLTLSYSSDNGATWTPAGYTTPSAPEVGSTLLWALATATIPTTGASSLSLKWECTIASVVRIDDIRVTATTGTPSSYLNASPSSVSFTDAAGTQAVTITSNTDWTVTASESWLTVTPASGSGNGAVTVTAQANTGAEERMANITVSGTGVTGDKTITVTQAAPEVQGGQTTLSEGWENGTVNESAAIGHWAFAKVQGDDKEWLVKEYSSSKYAEASGYGGTADSYELWLISPALNLDGASAKVVAFSTKGGYFDAASSLEVYILDSKTPNATTKTNLNARVANANDPKESTTYSKWVSSGDIDLSSYSGVRHIGFRYQGKAATYQLDDFLFGSSLTKALDVTPASLTFAAAGENKTFEVVGNTAWTAISDESWCTVSPTGGQSNGVITVTATENSGDARTATITVSGGTGVTDKTIAVTQAGASSGDSFSLVWNFKDVTMWAVDNSPCSTSPTITGSVEVVENLTQSNFSKSNNNATAKTWGGTGFNANTADNAATTNIYATVKIKSATKNLSLSTLSGNIRRSGTGPTNTAIFYKIGDGAFVAGPDISNGTATSGSGNTINADLSAITALQAIPAGTAITIKFVPYGASAAGGTWYLNSNSDVDALQISGAEQ